MPGSLEADTVRSLAGPVPVSYSYRLHAQKPIEVAGWMALTPPELVQTHLKLDGETMAALSKDKQVIVRFPTDRPSEEAGT